MRIVLDTSVLISGIYFGGPPGRILAAWRDQRVRLSITEAILDEYVRVARELQHAYPPIEPGPVLALIAAEAEFVRPRPLRLRVCQDPDDDKFVECALAGRTRILVSGDRKLQAVDGYRRLSVLPPRVFVDRYFA